MPQNRPAYARQPSRTLRRRRAAADGRAPGRISPRLLHSRSPERVSICAKTRCLSFGQPLGPVGPPLGPFPMLGPADGSVSVSGITTEGTSESCVPFWARSWCLGREITHGRTARKRVPNARSAGRTPQNRAVQPLAIPPSLSNCLIFRLRGLWVSWYVRQFRQSLPLFLNSHWRLDRYYRHKRYARTSHAERTMRPSGIVR